VVKFTLAPGGAATPTVSDQLLVPAAFIKSATGNANPSMEDLAGAVIDITAGTTYGGTPVATCTTSAKGTCTTGSTLISGDPYCWAETQAPPGLAIGPGGCFTATNDQGATPIDVSDPGEFTPVRVRKVDAADAADTLSGATFDLYRVNNAMTVPAPIPPTSPAPAAETGQTWVARATTDPMTGIATFGLQYPGYTYCALEVTAPANFAPTPKEHCTTGPTLPSTTIPPPTTTTITVADTPVMVNLRAHKFAAEAPDTVIAGAVYDLYVVGTLPPGGAIAKTPTTPAPTPESGDTWYARGTTNATGDLAWKVPAGYSWCLHEVTSPGEYAPETGLYCTSDLVATTPVPQTTIALPETVALVTISGRKYNATDPTEVIPGATYEAVGVGTPPPGYAPAPNPQGYPVPTGDWFYGTATMDATGLVTFTVPAGESWCLREVVVPADYQLDPGFHCTPMLMHDPPAAVTTLALPETPTGYQIVSGGGREPGRPAGPVPSGMLLLVGGLGITACGASGPWLSKRRRRARGDRPSSDLVTRSPELAVVPRSELFGSSAQPSWSHCEVRSRHWVYRWLAVACAGAAISAVGVIALASPTTDSPTRAAPLPARQFTIRPLEVAVGPLPDIGDSRLVVPSLGIDAPVISVGITDAQLDVPGDVHMVGEWSGGATPTGTSGTVLIAGHVNWAGQGPGALAHLASIAPDATVLLSTPRGTATTWSVTSVEAVTKADLPQTIFDRSGPHRLVLVTCGGAFNSATGHYKDNIVVTATPLPGE
jgi:hypothetical protein